jgi:hypothetical protein
MRSPPVNAHDGWSTVASQLYGFRYGFIRFFFTEWYRRFVSALSFLLSSSLAFSVALLVVFGLAGRLNVARWPSITALLFLVSISVINYIWPFLPNLPDAQLYHAVGRTASSTWQSGDFVPTAVAGANSVRELAFGYLLGFLYLIFGSHTLIGSFVASACFAASTVYWMACAHILQYQGRLAPIILSLSPAVVLYHTTPLREGVALLALSALSFEALRWLSSTSRPRIRGVVPLIVLIMVRPEIFMFSIGALVFAVFAEQKLTKEVGAIATLVSVSVVYLFEAIPGIPTPSLRFLEARRRGEVTRPNSYLTDWEYNSWFDVFATLPIRIVHLISSPFPWVPSNYGLFIVTVDSAYFLVIAATAAIAVWRTASKPPSPEKTYLISLVGAIVVGYALITSSQGVASRRRLYALAPLVVLSLPVFESFRKEAWSHLTRLGLQHPKHHLFDID